jgi:uncharacterized protein
MSENIESVEAKPVEAKPVSVNERIITLDVMRGFALLGIMFINVHGFVNPADWFSVSWQELSGVVYGIEVFKLVFTQGKFYTLFAFLFGLGFAVQLASAEKRGGGFGWRFFWRLTLLWLIGVFHLIFIWDGDILNTYAVGGVILLLLYLGKRYVIDKLVKRFSKTRDKAPRGLMLVVAALLLFGPLLGFGVVVYQDAQLVRAFEAGQVMTEDQQETIDRKEKRKDPQRQANRQQRTDDITAFYARASYIEVVSYRMQYKAGRLLSGPFWLTVCAIFLIGAYFGRNNFIGRARALKSGFVKLGVISLIVAIPLNIVFVYANIAKPPEGGMFWMWLGFLSKTSSGLAVALMFVSIITLAMLGSAQRWLRHFAPVGRMALTNYLAQSVVASIVFYGYGFGLLGKLNGVQQIGYLAIVFGLQMVISRWWLERYQFGPVEWLWRSLTYMKRQPMRILPKQEDESVSPA